MSLLWAADLVAITVLTFAVFFPRHQRRDLVTAYLGVNIGVLAVASTLASVEVGVGLGLGLFGVLSIIRLRSDELGQQAVAYYFAALALGLLGGLSIGDPMLTVGLMALIVGVLFVADHPRLLAGHHSQLVALDRAFTDRVALTAHLEALLGGQVERVHVRKLDLVSDTTTVEVHYRLPAQPHPGAAHDDAPRIDWPTADQAWTQSQGESR
ncbi:MAG: DUF4956 domain-containing protein [Candidatus Nanopelagicales bacterium]